MELLIIAHVWQKSSESVEKAQKRASESATVVSNSKNTPTVQTWLPIFQENFEGVTPPALPSGWTRVDGNNDGISWETFPPGTCAGSVSFNSKYACYDDDGAGQNSPATTEILRTPKIYVQGGANAYRVRFNYSFDAYSPSPVETFYVNLVYWSGNNPPTTVRILNLPGTADSLDKTFLRDITSYITGNNDTIQLEFVYRDAGDWGWAAGVDNVVVEGDYQLANDLATIGVNVQLTSGGYFFYPPGTSINYAGNIWVKVTNTGTNPQNNIPVYLRVNANNFGPLTISSLNSNQTDSVQFTNIPFNTGNNTIKAWHGISDNFVANDTFNTTYTPPTSKADSILNYPPSLTAGDAIGSQGNLGNSHEAVRYDSIAIWPFVVSIDSYYITKVFFYHCSTFQPSTCPGGTTRISLWMDDGTGKPNVNMEIIGKDTTLPSGTAGAKLWFVGLPNPIKVEQSLLPFYAGRNWNINNTFPFGIDNTSTCVANYSCWIRADAIAGGAWDQLTTYGLNYSWILGIVVQKKATGYEEVVLPNDARLFKTEIVKDGKLELNRPLDKNSRIEIYNLNGQIVRNIELTKGTTVINVGKLSKGVYVYVLDGKVGKIISQ
ncbi:MAG: T9SS type A sorting domain-containing protein [candidate division WOR-3 bacterium]|nr:T9SS type A sorting domain-containing protein [candidate division WOR-3 bacterium]